MKINFTSSVRLISTLSICCLILVLSLSAHAQQCTGGVNYGNLGSGISTTFTTIMAGDGYYEIDLFAGQSLTASTCNLANWDTYIILRNQGGTVVYSECDDQCGLQSSCTMVAPCVGTYEIRLGQCCCSSTSLASNISVTLGPAPCVGPPGCTDPVACNYDPAACPDCNNSCIYSGVNYATNYCLNQGAYSGACIPSGSVCDDGGVAGTGFSAVITETIVYQIQLQASFSGCGEGGNIEVRLNGNTVYSTPNTNSCLCFASIINITLTYEVALLTGDGSDLLELVATQGTFWGACNAMVFYGTAPVYGCTDPNAGNYNPAAHCDDGSCLPCLMFEMFDSYGDGWDSGGYYSVTNSQGVEVLTGTLPMGTYGTNLWCLPAGCYSLFVGGSLYNNEMTWTLNNAFGGPLSGGAPSVTSFTVGGPAGCLDSTACNYDPTAVCDNGSCEYISGCTDPAATNYNPNATCDNGLCVVAGANCIVLEMFDSGGNGWEGAGYEILELSNNFYLFVGGSLDNGSQGVVIWCPQSGCHRLDISDGTSPGEITWTLYGANEGTISGGADSNVYFSVGALIEGCWDSDACNYNPNANCGDVYDLCLYGLGCSDSEACNYDPNVFSYGCPDDALCIYPGCTDPAACNYDDFWGCDDGSCTYDEFGCTDDNACNYSFYVCHDDNYCTWPGCTNPEATNFNPDAGCSGGTCLFTNCLVFENDGAYAYYCNYYIYYPGDYQAGNPPIVYNYVGESYNSEIICLDDGCYEIYIEDSYACGDVPWTLYGTLEGSISGEAGELHTFFVGQITEDYCSDENACNYNPNANGYICYPEINNWTCVYPGCTDPAAVNYNPNAGCDDGSCLTLCEGDFDQNGSVNIADLLLVMTKFGCSSDCGLYDLDGNGAVNTNDLLIFMSLFGDLCP